MPGEILRKVSEQRPLNSFIENEKWYCRVAIGKNALNKFMVNLSTSARLSRANTNHCIRATCVPALDEAGVEARHIMTITGHKNEASIRSYSCTLSDEKKRDISTTISDTLIPSTSAEEPPQKKTPKIDEVFDAETDAILRELIFQAPLLPQAHQSLKMVAKCIRCRQL